ncbi:hypothetical protein PHISCL_06794 [Aspergillus sclerotialis]|uniref:Uncharacterized protein n=1 Tax=Aspergillus sclerotialis TaxID=2070753 RepID=A0A3A2ZV20_9EURO|nr:hypothetical protein PHISCL_06794 [Aspergillus sclerotialis]
MKHSGQTNRLLKRPRGSDAILEKTTDISEGPTKRCRLSQYHDAEDQPEPPEASLTYDSQVVLPRGGHSSNELTSEAWSLSHPLAGQYSDLDPILTFDEE